MVEILILYRLCSLIGYRAREKGRRAIGYQLMLILFWFVGQVGTILLAGLAFALLSGEPFGEDLLYAYLAAFLGAALGAWFAFRIVANLPEPGASEAHTKGQAPLPWEVD
jgi:hypothetical protein